MVSSRRSIWPPFSAGTPSRSTFRHPPTPALPRKGGGSPRVPDREILTPSPLAGEGRGGGAMRGKSMAGCSTSWVLAVGLLVGWGGASAGGTDPAADEFFEKAVRPI